MCGICGKLYFEKGRPVEKQLIDDMCSALRHRGPDDMGTYMSYPTASVSIGLGQTRLSIIDLFTGRQPISNEDKSIWVVLNGEIYNFKPLRASLIEKGHIFYTESDTEVIVHSYEEYGEEFVRHLNGMYGIAIWDEKKEKLILLRDRIGIKPLYYYISNDSLLFATEIKAILKDNIKREIDLQSLWNYLSYNYIPGPLTIFKGIRKLMPGHILIWEKGRSEIRQYWDLESSKIQTDPIQHHISENEYIENLYQKIKEAVRLQLVSDVPLGVFLSGGIDSSIVVAMMREVANSRIKTFSIGFEDRSYDELDYARIISNHFGTEHYELVVKMKPKDILPKLAYFFDEPFADFSAIPVYYLSEMTRKNVTVALGGDGGDELFAGYETYNAYKFANLYKLLPGFLSKGIIPAVVKRLPVSHKRISFDYKAKRFVRGALLPPAEAHFWWKVIFTEDAKKELKAHGTEWTAGLEDPFQLMKQHFNSATQYDTLSRLQYMDMKVYLPDDILTKVDRMSMAHALEVRPPFLDHSVVEYAFDIPSSMRLNRFTKKYILRKLMENKLPPKILQGKKRGFNVPVPSWLLNELRETVHDLLSPKTILDQGFFNADYVQKIIKEHEDIKFDHSRNIWGLLIFSLWYRQWMQT
jgi:asparagine synthase (glutamine-hydrolysing)